MRFFLTLIITLSIHAFAYIDADLDGVDDSVDRCPNTPLTELVDIQGCTIKSLVSAHHYGLIIGASYTQTDYTTLEKTDTLTSSLQVDYYYKNFALSARSSYYTSDSQTYSNKGMNDTSLSVAYQFYPSKNLVFRVATGVILPTYKTSLNNNNMDVLASVNVSYSLHNMNIFAAYARTMINDDDIAGVASYKDTNAYNAGLGFYPSSNLYLSGSYNTVDSIYVNVESIDTASAYAFYSINKHWFSTLSYAYGLSDAASKHYASIRLGYYF
ncbi:thrombospondin type 3 repeat-containing protein [Sulfurimonas sp. MAG313]|nr:thrombospondin type 3 repeat-containing protein [Sulfurimonas sp. MAG313]MDF1880419.1 thrombospondin type 3 repeat-containing protein [Sulfurimonas sp. MAG313]